MNYREISPTPEEQYESAKIQLAIYRMMQKETQYVNSYPVHPELEEHAKHTLHKRLDFIDQRVRTIQSRNTWKLKAIHVGKIAAMVILIFNLGLSIAVATNETIRKRTIQILMTMNSSYMEIKYIEGASVDVPVDWTQDYYPTYLPEGYEMTYYNPDGLIQMFDKYDNVLTIEILDENAVYSINVEGGMLESLQLHKTDATVIHQPNGDTSIIWSIGDRFFIVDGSEIDEVMKVAESIQRVNKK